MSLVYLPHMGLYYLILIGVICFYFILFRRIIQSIIDPVLFAVLGLSFAAAIPVLLFFTKTCPNKYFIYFVLSQLILICVFLLCIRKISLQTLINRRCNDFRYRNHFFFHVCTVIYLFSTLYSWYINGIPIFNESRFDININNSSGILGMLGHFSRACFMFCTLYVFFLYFHGRKIYASFLMLLFIGISMTSGSKGFIFNFVQAYFFYSVFYLGEIPRLKKRYIPLVAVAPLFVILLAGYANDGFSSILYFGYRLLANGDTYWNAYPNSVIDNLSMDNPILNMTYLFWGPFRHILGFDVDEKIFVTVGSLLFEYNYDFYPDAGAPNSQLSIVSYVYYKWGGLLLTGIIAFWGGWLFRRGYKCGHQDIFVCCKRSLLVLMGLSVFGDIYLFFSEMFDYFIFIGLHKCIVMLFRFIKIIHNEEGVNSYSCL